MRIDLFGLGLLDSASFFLFILLELVLVLFILKVSARWAYGRRVTWAQAAIQWISIIVIQLVILVVLSILIAFVK